MDSKDPKAQGGSGAPEAEVLQPRSADGSSTTTKPLGKGKLPHRSFRPSHKATFIAIIAIVVLLAGNAGVIMFVIKKQQATGGSGSLGAVSISSGLLSQLGVNKTAIGQSGAELIVSPNARFNGTVTVGNSLSTTGNANINKDAKVGGKLTASDSDLAQLQAGKTSLQELNVNGNSTVSNLNLRGDILVAGVSRLQGTVTIDKLLTVNNNVNISGNLTIGGTMTSGGFVARSLTSTSTLNVAGHIISGGTSPGFSPGGVLGNGGTANAGGNDTAGTVIINTGTGPSAGVLASMTFHTPFSGTPKVIVSPVGAATGNLQWYINRTATGFSIGTNNAPVGQTSYVFDYHVMQ